MDDEPWVQLVRWAGPWTDDDRDANLKADVALYSMIDPLTTVAGLASAVDVPVGAIVRYVLARWASAGSEGLLAAGPSVVNRMWAVCDEAERDGTDAAAQGRGPLAPRWRPASEPQGQRLRWVRARRVVRALRTLALVALALGAALTAGWTEAVAVKRAKRCVTKMRPSAARTSPTPTDVKLGLRTLARWPSLAISRSWALSTEAL